MKTKDSEIGRRLAGLKELDGFGIEVVNYLEYFPLEELLSKSVAVPVLPDRSRQYKTFDLIRDGELLATVVFTGRPDGTVVYGKIREAESDLQRYAELLFPLPYENRREALVNFFGWLLDRRELAERWKIFPRNAEQAAGWFMMLSKKLLVAAQDAQCADQERTALPQTANSFAPSQFIAAETVGDLEIYLNTEQPDEYVIYDGEIYLHSETAAQKYMDKLDGI